MNGNSIKDIADYTMVEINRNYMAHIVIIGAGFGGLTAANYLKNKPNLKITIIDKNNYQIFQPFLYQVAAADLSPSDITVPIRTQFQSNENVEIIMDFVIFIDKHHKKIYTKNNLVLSYDFLILATGGETNYFGNDEWKKYTINLKSLKSAIAIRNKLLDEMEKAERKAAGEHQYYNVTFAIIGGGPTGVELAGSIQELIIHSLKNDFYHVNTQNVKIVLIEAGSRLLNAFSESISDYTHKALLKKNIVVKLNTKVHDIKQHTIILENGTEIHANLIVWAAGVKANPVAGIIENSSEIASGTRIKVLPNLSLNYNSEIFAIGDVSDVRDKNDKQLPGLAAVANQQGKFVAEAIYKKIIGDESKFEFQYNDRGNLAIIGRYQAVFEYKNFILKGKIAWLVWNIVHIYFLIGFRNRLIVFIKWMWNYITHTRSERIIIK